MVLRLVIVGLIATSSLLCAQRRAVRSLAECSSVEELKRYDEDLVRLHDRIVSGRRFKSESIATVVADARTTLNADAPTKRMLAIRTLGVVAPRTPNVAVDLIAAVRDPNRRVRREALLQLGHAPMPSDEWARRARKAMLVATKGGKDVMLDALARRGRAVLLERMRKAASRVPAAPGGGSRSHRRGSARRNELAAIATLRNLSSAQAQFQATGIVDTNGNGAGEYGFFAELAGVTALRVDEKGGIGQKKLSPPVLSPAFARVKNGVVTRRGYCFRLFLPGAKGYGVAEAVRGGAKGCAVSAQKSELYFCAYAWPAVYGANARRCFFVDQTGDVWAANNGATRYAAPSNGPAAEAARPASEADRVDMTAQVSLKLIGRDGNWWSVVR